MSDVALPDRLESRLASQEADPTHIPAARAALEEAIGWQLRQVALRLLAYRLLHKKGRPSELVWWHQYTQNSAGQVTFMLPRTEDEGLKAFRRQVAQQMLKRTITPMNPQDATGLELRMLRGHVGIADEGRINAQLTALGSTCRYILEAGRELRAAQAARLTSLPVAPFRKGISFFFGEVEPATAVGRIRLFRFAAEKAVSPYENARSPMFYADGRLVVRDLGAAQLMASGLYGHEFEHVLTDLAVSSMRGVPSWRAVTRQDLCRYLQRPRSDQEIQRAFFPSWLGPTGELEPGATLLTQLLPLHLWFPRGEAPDANPIPGLVAELIRDGLVERRKDRYVCRMFEEGRRWLV